MAVYESGFTGNNPRSVVYHCRTRCRTPLVRCSSPFGRIAQHLTALRLSSEPPDRDTSTQAFSGMQGRRFNEYRYAIYSEHDQQLRSPHSSVACVFSAAQSTTPSVRIQDTRQVACVMKSHPSMQEAFHSTGAAETFSAPRPGQHQNGGEEIYVVVPCVCYNGALVWNYLSVHPLFSRLRSSRCPCDFALLRGMCWGPSIVYSPNTRSSKSPQQSATKAIERASRPFGMRASLIAQTLPSAARKALGHIYRSNVISPHCCACNTLI